MEEKEIQEVEKEKEQQQEVRLREKESACLDVHQIFTNYQKRSREEFEKNLTSSELQWESFQRASAASVDDPFAIFPSDISVPKMRNFLPRFKVQCKLTISSEASPDSISSILKSPCSSSVDLSKVNYKN